MFQLLLQFSATGTEPPIAADEGDRDSERQRHRQHRETDDGGRNRRFGSSRAKL